MMPFPMTSSDPQPRIQGHDTIQLDDLKIPLSVTSGTSTNGFIGCISKIPHI